MVGIAVVTMVCRKETRFQRFSPGGNQAAYYVKSSQKDSNLDGTMSFQGATEFGGGERAKAYTKRTHDESHFPFTPLRSVIGIFRLGIYCIRRTGSWRVRDTQFFGREKIRDGMSTIGDSSCGWVSMQRRWQ